MSNSEISFFFLNDIDKQIDQHKYMKAINEEKETACVIVDH